VQRAQQRLAFELSFDNVSLCPGLDHLMTEIFIIKSSHKYDGHVRRILSQTVERFCSLTPRQEEIQENKIKRFFRPPFEGGIEILHMDEARGPSTSFRQQFPKKVDIIGVIIYDQNVHTRSLRELGCGSQIIHQASGPNRLPLWSGQLRDFFESFARQFGITAYREVVKGNNPYKSMALV